LIPVAFIITDFFTSRANSRMCKKQKKFDMLHEELPVVFYPIFIDKALLLHNI